MRDKQARVVCRQALQSAPSLVFVSPWIDCCPDVTRILKEVLCLARRVTDFGLSNTLSVVSTDTGSGQPGTLIFAAPEILEGESLNSSSDVYSFGMLAFHLFSQGKLYVGSLMHHFHQQHHLLMNRSRHDRLRQWQMCI